MRTFARVRVFEREAHRQDTEHHCELVLRLPCISANNVRVAIEPNRTPLPIRRRTSTTPRFKVVCLQGDGHREENEPIAKTHGLRTVLLLTVPKARYPKASLVPTSACAAKDATFNRRQHHESPMSSQHGGRLCSVEALESELLRTPVSEQSIGNCEIWLCPTNGITRGTKEVWKRARSRGSVNAPCRMS